MLRKEEQLLDRLCQAADDKGYLILSRAHDGRLARRMAVKGWVKVRDFPVTNRLHNFRAEVTPKGRLAVQKFRAVQALKGNSPRTSGEAWVSGTYAAPY